MRWRSRRARPAERLDTPIGELDAATLEVVELDPSGRPVAPATRTDAGSLREVAERPDGRDATGTAGIWEALSRA